jgi:uncharacterized membrane protein HdeD (DUF308 family)
MHLQKRGFMAESSKAPSFSALSEARGVLLILFGLAALAFEFAPWLNLVLAFAAYAMLEGALTVISSSLIPRGSFSRWTLLFEGCFTLAVGFVTIAYTPLWSIALPWLIAAWAALTGLLVLVMSIRLRLEIAQAWMPILAGAIRLGYGVLGWFLPWSFPDIGDMSGRSFVFLVLTAGFGILSGTLMLAWGFRSRLDSVLLTTRPNNT